MSDNPCYVKVRGGGRGDGKWCKIQVKVQSDPSMFWYRVYAALPIFGFFTPDSYLSGCTCHNLKPLSYTAQSIDVSYVLSIAKSRMCAFWNQERYTARRSNLALCSTTQCESCVDTLNGLIWFPFPVALAINQTLVSIIVIRACARSSPYHFALPAAGNSLRIGPRFRELRDCSCAIEGRLSTATVAVKGSCFAQKSHSGRRRRRAIGGKGPRGRERGHWKSCDLEW